MPSFQKILKGVALPLPLPASRPLANLWAAMPHLGPSLVTVALEVQFLWVRSLSAATPSSACEYCKTRSSQTGVRMEIDVGSKGTLSALAHLIRIKITIRRQWETLISLIWLRTRPLPILYISYWYCTSWSFSLRTCFCRLFLFPSFACPFYLLHHACQMCLSLPVIALCEWSMACCILQVGSLLKLLIQES